MEPHPAALSLNSALKRNHMKRRILAFLMLAGVVSGQNIATVNRDRTYYPETYGAKPDDSLNDKTGIQNAINSAETAGGGRVMLREGVWEIHPLATGIGLLVPDGVSLEGEGDGTIIRVKTSTITTGAGGGFTGAGSFCGIAPKGYNTATTPYSAESMVLRNFRIECDAYTTSSNGAWAGGSYSNAGDLSAALIGVGHSPRALIENVTFGQNSYHQLEVNNSKSTVVRNCRFVGLGQGAKVQLDTGAMGQLSSDAAVYSGAVDGVYFVDCDFASRDMTGETLTTTIPRMIELAHGTASVRNVTFERCRFGTLYKPAAAAYLGYTIHADTNSGSVSELSNVNIRDSVFLGDVAGATHSIYVAPSSSTPKMRVRGFRVEGCYFGPGLDAEGAFFAGGFASCINLGAGSLTDFSGSSTSATDYELRGGYIIRGNLMEPRWVDGRASVASGRTMRGISIIGAQDALVEGNTVNFAVHNGTFSADATTDELTCISPSSTEGMMHGDPIAITASGGLPTGMGAGTYYVQQVLSSSKFKISSSLNGSTLNFTTNGTSPNNWATLNTYYTPTYYSGIAVAEVANARVLNNTINLRHGLTAIGTSLGYTMMFNVRGLEAAGAKGFWEVVNNRINVHGAGSAVYGATEFSTSNTEVAAPGILGRWEGNHSRVVGSGTGAVTNPIVIYGHPRWFNEGQTVTLAADASAVTSGTLANVTGLTATVNAGLGVSYRVDGEILYTTPAATDGVKLALTIPSGATVGVLWTALSADTGEVTETYSTASGSGLSSTTRPASGTVWRAKVSGYVTGGSAGGSVTVQVASEVTASTVVKAGSFLRVGNK